MNVSKFSSSLHIETGGNLSGTYGSHATAIKSGDSAAASNSGIGSPVKFGPLPKRVAEILFESGCSSGLHTPKIPKTPKAGTIVSLNSGLDASILNQALVAVNAEKKYLEETLPRELNQLCGIIFRTNFDRIYQIDQYHGNRGMSNVIARFAIFAEILEKTKDKESFCVEFMGQFDTVLVSLEAKLIESDDSENIDSDDTIDSPTEKNGWLEELKLRLNISNVASTLVFPTRKPEEQDFVAVKFLEECVARFAAN